MKSSAKVTLGIIAVISIAMAIPMLMNTMAEEQEQEILVGYNITGDMVEIFNFRDTYRFNISQCGMQWVAKSADYQKLGENTFCAGYYNATGDWVKIACVDELDDCSMIIDSDNNSYVNLTFWKDISYSGWDFRFAINRDLQAADYELPNEFYLKSLNGEDTPFKLGFAWLLRNITLDSIRINRTDYSVSQHGTKDFKNMTKISFPAMLNRTIIQYHPEYRLYSSISNDAYMTLRWNKSLDYVARISSDGTQESAQIIVALDAGTFAAGQAKSTTFFWRDPDLGYIDPDEDITTPGESMQGCYGEGYCSYTCIDDSVRNPEPANWDDGCFGGEGENGASHAFGFETIEGASTISEITLWETTSSDNPDPSCTWNMSVWINGEVIGYEYSGLAGEWYMHNFSGSWTKSDLDTLNLMAELKTSDCTGGGAYFPAAYFDVFYETAAEGTPTDWRTFFTFSQYNPYRNTEFAVYYENDTWSETTEITRSSEVYWDMELQADYWSNYTMLMTVRSWGTSGRSVQTQYYDGYEWSLQRELVDGAQSWRKPMDVCFMANDKALLCARDYTYLDCDTFDKGTKSYSDAYRGNIFGDNPDTIRMACGNMTNNLVPISVCDSGNDFTFMLWDGVRNDMTNITTWNNLCDPSSPQLNPSRNDVGDALFFRQGGSYDTAVIWWNATTQTTWVEDVPAIEDSIRKTFTDSCGLDFVEIHVDNSADVDATYYNGTEGTWYDIHTGFLETNNIKSYEPVTVRFNHDCSRIMLIWDGNGNLEYTVYFPTNHTDAGIQVLDSTSQNYPYLWLGKDRDYEEHWILGVVDTTTRDAFSYVWDGSGSWGSRTTHETNTINKQGRIAYILQGATMDITNPTCSFITPISGTVINGFADIIVDSQDSGGIALVYWQYYNVSLSSWQNVSGCADSGEPYTCGFNSSANPFAEQAYDFRAISTDQSGNQQICPNITYTFDRSIPQIKDITLNVTFPTYSADFDSLNLTANVTDAGSAKIQYVQLNLLEINQSDVYHNLTNLSAVAQGIWTTWWIPLFPSGITNTSQVNATFKIADTASPTNNIRYETVSMNIDAEQPYDHALGASDNPIDQYENVSFGVEVVDDVSLEFYILSHNNSGSYVNDTIQTIQGNLSKVLSVSKNMTANGTTCFLFYYGDQVGHNTSTEIECIDVTGLTIPQYLYNVTQIKPENGNYTQGETMMNFSFTAYGGGSLSCCSMFFFGNPVNTTCSVTENTSVSFFQDIGSQPAEEWIPWFVSCNDTLGRSNITSTWEFLRNTTDTCTPTNSTTWNINSVDRCSLSNAAYHVTDIKMTGSGGWLLMENVLLIYDSFNELCTDCDIGIYKTEEREY